MSIVEESEQSEAAIGITVAHHASSKFELFPVESIMAGEDLARARGNLFLGSPSY